MRSVNCPSPAESAQWTQQKVCPSALKRVRQFSWDISPPSLSYGVAGDFARHDTLTYEILSQRRRLWKYQNDSSIV